MLIPHKREKGFTLIELLVVIAIIGILATVVTTTVNSARNKAANASVKASLKSILPAVEILLDKTNSYAAICINPEINKIDTSAGVVGGGIGVCNNFTSRWAASAPLKVSEDDNYPAPCRERPALVRRVRVLATGLTPCGQGAGFTLLVR